MLFGAVLCCIVLWCVSARVLRLLFKRVFSLCTVCALSRGKVFYFQCVSVCIALMPPMCNALDSGENNDFASRLHHIYTDIDAPHWSHRPIQPLEVLPIYY